MDPVSSFQSWKVSDGVNRFKRKDSCVVLLFWGFDYISDITEKKKEGREREKKVVGEASGPRLY